MTDGKAGWSSSPPDQRMFIGQSIPSVDRGETRTGVLFIARRPDSPYLVPGVDVEYVRADLVDRLLSFIRDDLCDLGEALADAGAGDPSRNPIEIQRLALIAEFEGND